MYNITREQKGIYSVTFDFWEVREDCFDPALPFVKTAAKLSGAKTNIIEDFLEYEISCDDFCAELCWDGGFTIMVYVKRETEPMITFEALKNACAYMNKY